MRVIPASSKTVTVGTQTWSSLIQESSRIMPVPPNAMTLEEISAQLKEAGMPCGKGYTLRYVREIIRRGLATEHRVIRSGRLSKAYSLKDSK